MSSPLLESTSKPRIKKGHLIRMLIVLLLVSAVAFAIWMIQKPRLPFSMKDYEQAVLAGDDARIFHIYNTLREKRADLADKKSSDTVKRLDELSESIILRIEDDAIKKSDNLLRRTLEGQSLLPEEIEWLEQYFVMAGQGMMQTVKNATASYLIGDLEESSFLHFLHEVTGIPRLTREYSAILDRFDTVTSVRERLEKADEYGQEAKYYEEAIHLEKIVSETDFTGLEPVFDYLSERLSRVWQRYYDEQIVYIRHEMAHDRTYDAGIRLEKLLSHFTENAELLNFKAISDERNPDPIITWWDPVEHIAIKPIIADPMRAFDGDKYQAAADRDLLLADEFERILQKLYENQYVLVDSDSFVSQEGKLMGIACPRGKKPLVLVLEDFYGSFPRAESGVAFGLDLNDEGETVGFLLEEDGRKRMDRRYTAIGILEEFIEKHPDFSFNGATGTIALVGQYGLLGHPVADVQELALLREAKEAELAVPDNWQGDYAVNRETVKKLLEALEAKNWHLASGTYGRLSLPYVKTADIARDLAMMEMWVLPYTGPLKELYCPFGDHVEQQKAKAKLFSDAGYLLQSGYGAWAYWHNSEGYVYVSRTFVSGDGLRHPGTYNLNRLFDTGGVIQRDLRP